MKHIYKFSALAILLLLVYSCNSDDEKIVANAISAPVLVAPEGGSAFVLVRENANNIVFNLNWTKSDYGIPTDISYNVEIALANTQFVNAVSAGIVSTNTIALTVAALNSAVTAAGANALQETEIEIRIKSSLGPKKDLPMYSNSIHIKVTPYATIVAKNDLFLVGNATAAGWNNDSDNTPLFRDPMDENKFYYTGFFTGGADFGFKILDTKGSWHPQYGGSGGILGVSTPTGENEPAIIPVAISGYYNLEVNITTMTYAFTPVSTPPTVTYPTIGIVGDATPGGWDTDTDMTNSTFDPHIWKISGVTLSNNNLKFRANNNWDVNWGADTSFSGIATIGGGDIPVLASKYDIWFNDIDGRYLFILLP